MTSRWRQLARVLDDIEAVIRRYVILPTDSDYVVVTLFVAHTHVAGVADTTPRLSLQSPEKRCGKTRLLEVLSFLVARPLMTANASPAALYRTVSADGEHPPTVLFDEADTVFGPKSSERGEELRGLLNTGYRRGSNVLRVKLHGTSVEELAVFCPAVIAAIGHAIPDTITDRGPVINMRRRKTGEHVEPFRMKAASLAPLKTLHDELEAWADAARDKLRDAEPVIPASVTDRAADYWEPLLVVAELAGNGWSQRARNAAIAKVAEADQQDAGGLSLELLRDCRAVWETKPETSRVISSLDLVRALKQLVDGQWLTEDLNAHRLGRLLSPYQIKSKKMRIEGNSIHGYSRDPFDDAFERYLKPENPED